MAGVIKEKRHVDVYSASDESEVEWRKDLLVILRLNRNETVSKGNLIEEVNFEEAIKRSIYDIGVSFSP